MEALLNSLGTVWGAPGIIIGLLVLGLAYMYRRVENLQKEHVETLKVTLPLMANFESTMKTAINVLSKAGGEK